MTAPLSSALRRRLRSLASVQQARTDALPQTSVQFGTVTTATAGAAADGGTAVTVTLDSGTVQSIGYVVPYDSTFAPKLGDRVLVLTTGRYPIIVGKLAGLPTY